MKTKTKILSHLFALEKQKEQMCLGLIVPVGLLFLDGVKLELGSDFKGVLPILIFMACLITYLILIKDTLW